MAADEIHVGDIGTVLRGTITDGSSAVDVSGASTKQLILRKPSGGRLAKDASFTTDGTNGQIQYTTVDGDLDEAGLWQIQGYVVLAGSGTWRSDVSEFEVYANL